MPFDDAAKPIDRKKMLNIVTTNFLVPIRMTSAMIEHLKKKPQAVIINTTSVMTFVPLAYNALYSATKASLHSFTMSQRFTLRDTSVRKQEIAPPRVDTDLVKKSGDPRAMPFDPFVEKRME